jgi:hypothetical protein
MRMLLAPLMVVLVAANAWARDGSRGFSNSDIKGNYSWFAQGSSIVSDPKLGTDIAFPVVVIGTVFSDGRGNMQGTGTVNLSRPGSALTTGEKVSLSLTYEVEEDGTGQWSGAVNPNGPPSVLGSGAMVIGPNDEVQVVSTQTAPDRVVYTTVKKQHFPSGGFSNATLGGAWAFTCHGALVTSTETPPVIEPVAVIGLMTNDGHGKFSASVTANTNGVVTQEDFTGCNSVSSDGLVSATATSTDTGCNSVSSDGLVSATATSTDTKPLLANLSGVVDNRHEFRVITTDPGRFVSCAFKAQGRPDEGRDKRRRHAR